MNSKPLLWIGGAVGLTLATVALNKAWQRRRGSLRPLALQENFQRIADRLERSLAEHTPPSVDNARHE